MRTYAYVHTHVAVALMWLFHLWLPMPGITVNALAPLALARANLSGQVRQKAYPTPIPGARVQVATLGLLATSDAGGHFGLPAITLPGAGPLPVTITVDAPGYGQWMLTGARLIPDDTLILDVELDAQPTRINLPAPDTLTRSNALLEPPLTLGLPLRQPAYQSQVTPPATIRVRVTGVATCSTSITYTVQSIPFADYARHVLPNEWIASWPTDSLRAGAMAVKTYAWYWVNRGGKWNDADVYDSTCDQVYNPAVSYAKTNAAVNDTWGQRMVSNGQIFHASYRAYSSQCPANAVPGCMGQWDSRDMANAGQSWQDILRHFYTPLDITDTVPLFTQFAFLPLSLR
jgi:hypothetical protein